MQKFCNSILETFDSMYNRVMHFLRQQGEGKLWEGILGEVRGNESGKVKGSRERKVWGNEERGCEGK